MEDLNSSEPICFWMPRGLERIERMLRMVEERDRMLYKDRLEYVETFEEVFDRPTLEALYILLRRGILTEIIGTVKAGKESRVYWGKGPNGEDVAVKIYLTLTAEFRRGILKYIEGDPRFKRIRRDQRSLIYAWASKEFKNLRRAYEAGVRVPKPYGVMRNVLVMEFIGEDGEPAPLLKDCILEDPEEVYAELMEMVRLLYQKAELVHGDLSEYNIMVWDGKPVLFDVSQAVPLSHPLAHTLLCRDLRNLARYFSNLGVPVLEPEEAYRWVTGGGEIPR